jgi:hypothetical protein
LFFILILLLRELCAPDLLSRFQALSPDFFLRGAFAGNDPSDLELRMLMLVLNFDLVSNLHLALATSQLHPMVTDIESMRKMAILTSGDPEAHWHDRFGSFRLPFSYAKSRHVPRSLRIAVVAFLVIIFFLPVVLLLLVLVWLLTKENIGGQGAIRGVRIKLFWIHSVHAQWYAS